MARWSTSHAEVPHFVSDMIIPAAKTPRTLCRRTLAVPTRTVLFGHDTVSIVNNDYIASFDTFIADAKGRT